jgi:site-specific recombinase XerD
VERNINFNKLKTDTQGKITRVKKKPVKHSKKNALEPNESLELFREIKNLNVQEETKYKYQVIIHLMMDCGLRITEALQVRLDWFKDSDDGLLLIIPDKARDLSNMKRDWNPKTVAGARELFFIDPGIGEKVRSYFINNPKGIGFSRQRGYQIIKMLGEKIKKPGLHPHALRSTYANTLVRMGTQLDTLCYFMGWDDLNTARNYVKTSNIAARNDLIKKYRESKE